MKTFDLNIQDNQSTILPGYMPQTDNFGLDFGYTPPDSFGSGFPKDLPPGIPFILGSQKDIRNQAGSKGWISRDPAMANFYGQTKTQNITAKTGFVLIRDLKVDLTANRTSSLNQTSVYNYNPGLGQYVNSSENITGMYSISYIALPSHFGKVDSVSAFFDQFSDNRKVISKRLSNNENGYNQEFQKFELSDGYQSGYDRSSQDVLIPAFLSAYGISNVNLISTNPMPNIPLPNWSAKYDGLTKIPGLKELFKSFTLSHAYRCTYNVGNFTRNIISQDSPRVQRLDPVTDVSGSQREMFNFRPVNQINTVAITEQFSPFIGANATWKNGMTTGFDFNRDRNLSFNVGNKQLTEAKSKDLSFNLGWRKDKLNKTLRLFGRDINLKNALNAQMRISIRNTKTRNRTLDFDGPAPVTNGNTTISIAPSVDYTISKRLNIRAFIDHTINRPAVANSFPTSFTNFGIQLRFSLTG
jgi:cell surface protein SprA